MTIQTLTKSSIGWFLVVTLATTVLMHILGFLSPFASMIKHDGKDEAAHAMDLFEWASSRLPWLTPLYLIPIWKILQTVSPKFLRVALMAASVVLLIFPLTQRITPPATEPVILNAVAQAGLFAMFLFCSYIVWRNLAVIERQSR